MHPGGVFFRSRPGVFVLLALGMRVAALAYFPAPEPNYYWTLSENLLKHHTFALESGRTAYMEPLYPAFLAAARSISGDVRWLATFVQVLVAAAGAAFLYALTLRVAGSRGAASCAGLFYALDPYFVRQSVSSIELPVLVTLLLWGMYQFYAIRTVRGAALSGLLLGALYLTRASLLPVVLGGLVLVAVRYGVRSGTAAIAAAALAAVPWIVRNDGAVVPTRLGENLFVSTSEYAIGVLPEHDVDLLMPFAYAIVDRELPGLHPSALERPADALLLRRALAFIRAHPREALQLKVRNLLYLFWPGLLPVEAKSPETSAVLEGSRVRITGARARPRPWEWLHFAERTLLLVTAVVGIVLRRACWRQDALLYLVILSAAAASVLFFPTTRLLAPMTAVLMVFAGVGANYLIRPGARGAPPGRGANRHDPR